MGLTAEGTTRSGCRQLRPWFVVYGARQVRWKASKRRTEAAFLRACQVPTPLPGKVSFLLSPDSLAPIDKLLSRSCSFNTKSRLASLPLTSPHLFHSLSHVLIAAVLRVYAPSSFGTSQFSLLILPAIHRLIHHTDTPIIAL